jgi:hypothetical protein
VHFASEVWVALTYQFRCAFGIGASTIKSILLLISVFSWLIKIIVASLLTQFYKEHLFMKKILMLVFAFVFVATVAVA